METKTYQNSLYFAVKTITLGECYLLVLIRISFEKAVSWYSIKLNK